MAIEILDELNTKWQQRYPGLAKLQFSDWVPWRQRNAILGVNKVGVYILAKYKQNELPKSVDPVDKNIIYVGKTNVGKTTSIKNRLNAFDRAAFGNEKGRHSGGENYKKLYRTDQSELCVSVCPIYWAEKTKQLSDEVAEVHLFRVITWLEVCLRGVYVLKWGRLPSCNKE